MIRFPSDDGRRREHGPDRTVEPAGEDERPAYVGSRLIAREWRGETAWIDADDYAEHLCRAVTYHCRDRAGNRGVLVRRYREGDRAVFLVATLWDSEDALRRAFGTDWERCTPFQFDPDYLLAADEYAQPADVLTWSLAEEKPLER